MQERKQKEIDEIIEDKGKTAGTMNSKSIVFQHFEWLLT